MWAAYGTEQQDGCHDIYFFSLSGGSGTLLWWGGANETAGWVGFCDG